MCLMKLSIIKRMLSSKRSDTTKQIWTESLLHTIFEHTQILLKKNNTEPFCWSNYLVRTISQFGTDQLKTIMVLISKGYSRQLYIFKSANSESAKIDRIDADRKTHRDCDRRIIPLSRRKKTFDRAATALINVEKP